MRTFEAMAEVMGRHTTECAEAVGLKAITLNKWKESPERSGTVNPLDRIEALTAKSLELGRGEAAYAAIRYLCRRFGLYAIPISTRRPDIHDISEGLVTALKEYADFAAVSTDALRDRALSPQERNSIEREAWEAQEAIAAFLDKVCCREKFEQ